MAILCAVSGKIRDANRPIEGAIITLESVLVGGSPDASYQFPSQWTTDSNGIFTLNVPRKSVIRFSSFDVSDLDGWSLTVPDAPEFFVGVFVADTITLARVRERFGGDWQSR